MDSFSGFSDRGGRFAVTTESVHCPHLPCFVRSDVESCHACAGVQVSRCSKKVLEAAPFMEKLPRLHWRVLMRSMRMTEGCFEAIGDTDVVGCCDCDVCFAK